MITLKEKINLLFRLTGKLNLYVNLCESTLQKKRIISDLEEIIRISTEIYNTEKDTADYEKPTTLLFL